MPNVKLSVRSPSDTTTLYTLSNARECDAPLARARWMFTLGFRVVLALCSSVTLALQFSTAISLGDSFELKELTVLEAQWTALMRSATWPEGRLGLLIAGICFVLLYVTSRRDHIEESLLVIRSLGIQTSTSSSSYLSMPSTRFIPTSQIQDIFIHEAFRGFEVRFYLAVIVRGEEEAVVVFPRLLPRRPIVEKVWRGARQVLWAFGDNKHNEKHDER